ncbi:hypothetical protein ADL05_02430 [Nocardiopsis sp. NRRL B-16309]|nr:hypothetical protein ADL05_02430 [Nocardiopsis sp. NRRL B-16309]
MVGLAVAGLCGFLTRRAKTRIRAMESTETLAVAELGELHRAAVGAAGEGVFRQRCEVAGVVRPHRRGALSSELAKVSCVWHQHRVTREYEKVERDGDGDRRTVTRNQVVARHTTDTAFFLEDDTGTLVVRPGGHDVENAEKVTDRFRPHRGGGSVSIGPVTLRSDGGTVGFKEEEWVLRPGTRLFVHGEAFDTADGRLEIGAPAEGGTFIMSTRSEAELLRGENGKLRGFGIATGAAALVGVVLLAIGAVSALM